MAVDLHQRPIELSSWPFYYDIHLSFICYLRAIFARIKRFAIIAWDCDLSVESATGDFEMGVFVIIVDQRDSVNGRGNGDAFTVANRGARHCSSFQFQGS